MIWLTWRQHRSYIAAGLGLLALLAAVMLPTGIHLYGLFDQAALPCLGTAAAASDRCTVAVTGLGDTLRAFYDPLVYLNLAPALVGAFVGAPLISREVERGTAQLVWTQGISRLRWVGSKMALLAVVTVALAIPLTALVSWWLGPQTAMFGDMQAASFDFLGLMPASHALFAFALGCAVGSALTRTMPAMAVTLVGFMAVYIAVRFWLRPIYLPPLTRVRSLSAPTADRGTDWILSNYLVNHQGMPLSDRAAGVMCPFSDNAAWTACMQRNGLGQGQLFQPADRFWPFQGIEAGIYVGLAVALLALALWRVHSHPQSTVS